MMNYGMGNMNPYINPQQQMSNLINQYPQYFSPAVQQAVATQTPQMQQQITTQPPILQPQTNSRNSVKMVYVGNREEATATPVDLIYNTPTFFYNKGTNEVYMKQYDSLSGNANFKTFAEIQPVEEPLPQNSNEPKVNPYERELRSIREGIDGLYRILLQPQMPYTAQGAIIKEVNTENLEVEIEQPEKQQKKGEKNGNHKANN